MSLVDVEPIPSVLTSSTADTSPSSSAVSAPATASGGSPGAVASDSSDDFFHDVDLEDGLDGISGDGVEAWGKLDGIRISGPGDFTNVSADKVRKPFHKWMKTLHRRATYRQVNVPGGHGFRLRSSHHRKSSSGSSSAFVTAMQSASISLTSVSFLSRSRRNTVRSSRGHSRTDRSSGTSVTGVRLSTDSAYVERPLVIDRAVTERSLQRRRILEELIETEESYIGDVRFLMNVYITILASLPTLSPGLRSSINQNLTDIVQLHEELLGDLHRVVPDSEYTHLDIPPPVSRSEHGPRGHKRWKSLDAVPEDNDGITWLHSIPGMMAEPHVAAEVAKLFSKKMNRFFIYEEYGAKYELMIKDVASAHRTMPKWESYQKGLETLAAALDNGNSHDDHAKKSLTIGDLLVKPIQRVCRYPLLFAELLKYTPVCDCPHSHMEIEDTLARLREATAEINRATDDTRIKATLEKTWILQDRLVFPNQSLDAASKNQIRSFGHIRLCGALHICWQTKEGVTGQYMVALLYRDRLCLAIAGRVDQIYTIQACIDVTTAKVEAVDNGRGIQCHTAPYSWKLVFLCDHQLYEIIMSACTFKEEQEWRGRLSHAAGSDPLAPNQQPAFDSLSLNIKALGTVFGKPGTIARRISVHRATTVGPKTPLCQVILKNTSVVRDAPVSASGSPINRSMSLLTTNNRIPILAPSRGERARLEALLSDVWTRDILPFPGITARSRSEYLVKASASSMMRKLSVASITGSFSRRSTSSQTSMRRTDSSEEVTGYRYGRGGKTSSYSADSEALSSIVDETSPACPVVESEWGIDVLRTVGHIMDEAKRREGQETGREGNIAAVSTAGEKRPSTAGSKGVKRKASTLTKVASYVSEKEILVAEPRTGKWTKVGVLHREAVVQGIRGFFR